MKHKHIIAHMRAAFLYAGLSSCIRRQTGCLIVKRNTPIAIGYNGTPSGEDNTCEDEEGTTKPNVAHAEDNALRKLTRSSESAEGTIVFSTKVPCIRCAERLVDAGVQKVYWTQGSRRGIYDGLEYLEKHIEVEQIPESKLK